MFLRLTIVYLLCICTQSVFAQKKNNDDWEPDLELISRKFDEVDSSLSAKIIFDYGKCIAEPRSGTKFTQHRRIKIYKRSALDKWANFEIAGEAFRLINFNCRIYNYENGKIEITSLEKEDLLKENLSKKIDRFVIPLPNVKEGSVIEYQFSVKTHIYTIKDWAFQHSIPIDQSEYEIFFPGGFFGVTAGISGLYNLYHKSVKQGGKLRRYIMRDLPAFEPEPNMPYEHLFRSSIIFKQGNPKGFEEIYIRDVMQNSGIPVESEQMDTKITGQINIELLNTGELQGRLILVKQGYEAITGREEIQDSGKEQFLKSQLNESGWSILEQTVENAEDPDVDLTLKYSVNLGRPVQIGDSLIYINPNIVIKDEVNPFKLETRVYPLDLGSRMVRIMTVIIKIPEGYEVDELPKSSFVELADKSANYAINISKTPTEVFITSRLKIDKIFCTPHDYPGLRAFMVSLISKRNEPIILKKVSH